MPILSAQEVTKKFGEFTALNSVSLDVPANSIFGLLGPNGAGKTTLIRIINQITAPDTGIVYLSGEKLKPEHTQNIGYLPEERGLYRKMKVGEQAVYLAQLKNLSRKEALKRLKYWFEKFGITSWWNKKVEELSKGMQQKVQFIVTVIHKPELLIFDEPFSGFDPINVNLLKDEILKLKEDGATIIFSTHNMSSVEELCDHIALINKSEKILEGRVSDIKNNFKANRWKIDFTGDIEVEKYINGDAQIIGVQDIDDGLKSIDVKILEDKPVNPFLEKLLPQIEIKKVEEIIPSMNDIFIKAVEGEENKNNQSHE